MQAYPLEFAPVERFASDLGFRQTDSFDLGHDFTRRRNSRKLFTLRPDDRISSGGAFAYSR